uniref:Amine oxidase domain-containing protein n=1 Tax=Cuerna arida TaxID=1464854 RepID=A0A1B6G6I5_9HEMI
MISIMNSWVVLFTICFSTVYCDSGAERHRVVVVGAGASGFSAAAALLENDVSDIVVLEASSRIGGRILTVEYGGVPIDVGAEYCDGMKENVVYDYANPHDLVAVFAPGAVLYANTSGHIFDNSEVQPLVDQAYSIIYENDIRHFKGSVGDYFFPRLEKLMNAKDVEPELREALQHLIPQLEGLYSSTDDLHHLGAWGSTEDWENEMHVLLNWKSGGFKTIFDFMSKRFGDPSNEIPVESKVRLEKQVTKIEQRGGEVHVETADGSTFLTDHVIVTLPLGVLKDRAAQMFHPPLPEKKTTAIETLGYGCGTKVFMLFPEKWWTVDNTMITPLFSAKELSDYRANSEYGYWSANTTAFLPVLNHGSMLCAWFSGTSAEYVETLPEDEVVDGLMELLDKLVGKTFKISRPVSILRSNWCSDPLIRGTVSYRSVASDSLNISNTDLQQPILDSTNKPVILFAGEATDPHYHGSVQAAISAGRREAQNIIDYLKKDVHTQHHEL